jgi:hypothetical protein
MGRLQTCVTIAAMAVAVCSLQPAGTSFAQEPSRVVHQDYPPRPGSTPIVIGLPNLNPPTATPVPPASNPHKPVKPAAPPDAVRLALGNGYVKALLKGKAYRVQKVAPWPAGKGKLVVAGFYHSTTVSGLWLAAGKAPYRATYHNVVSLQIYVQIARRTVIAIVPHTVPK